MKKRVGLNAVLIIISVLYVAVLWFTNVQKVSISVAVVEGSYAEKYANKNHLQQYALSDSQKGYFDLRYETFDYDVDGNAVVINGYSGKSEELVIPTEIAGYTVSRISKDFWNSAKGVKQLFVPSTLNELLGDPQSNIVINCYSDSSVLDSIIKANWTVNVLNDSDYVNFENGNLEFEYNVKEDGVEIMDYRGDDSLLLIPSYVDGIPVTMVSMDFIGKYDAVVFPETVKSITGKMTQTLFTPVFFIEMIFTIIAILLVFAVFNAVFPRLKKKEEYLLSGSKIVISFVYVLFQIVFGFLNIYGFISINLFIVLIVSVVALALYLACVFSSDVGREHAIAVESAIEESTSYMKELKANSIDLGDSVKDLDLKKVIDRFVEELKYSDPSSTKNLFEVEVELSDAIDSLRSAIENEDKDAIINLCSNAERILKKRNTLCKRLKK